MNKWHNFRFRILTLENGNTRWWIDIFIIDTIVRDTLSENRSLIELWRVHRRASKDETGHQLTFHCFADDPVSKSINDLITQSDAFNFLQTHQLLRRYFCDEGAKPAVEDTSDKIWSVELQKSWPYYINGVSEMLLNLIGRLKTQVTAKMSPISSNPSLTEVESLYNELNNRLMAVWQQEGSHAFFHHINALFGYIPLMVQPRSITGILATF